MSSCFPFTSITNLVYKDVGFFTSKSFVDNFIVKFCSLPAFTSSLSKIIFKEMIENVKIDEIEKVIDNKNERNTNI